MNKETIKQAVAPYMAELAGLADQIYDLAEPGLEEVRSSGILTRLSGKKWISDRAWDRRSSRLHSVPSMNREKEDLPLDSWQSTTR